jgi:hypothetical protein
MVHFAPGTAHAAPDGLAHAAFSHAASKPTGSAHTASAHTARRLADADDLDRIGEEIASLAAHIHAAQYQLLALLAEFDEREGWSGSGFRSCAHWLTWRTGVAPGASREKVRTARALRTLPRVGEAMRKGELSFAKVRAITRVATAENEAELLDVARSGTAAQVERIVRAWRRVDRLEEQHAEAERHEARHLSLYVDDDGMYVIRGRLDPETGALLAKALESAADALCGRRSDSRSRAAHRTEPTPAAQRRADAMRLVAERALAERNARSSGSPVEVVVHVDAATLRDGSTVGQSVIAGGARVSAETSRRLACDAGRVVMTCDEHGNTLSVGRRTRIVPTAIRRALEYRDDSCRFPGCDMRHCDAHHIVHWADGGSTALDNLVLLCRRHHRAVHEGAFRVGRSPTGDVQFHHRDGRCIPAVPDAPPLQGDLVTMQEAEGLRVDSDALITFASGQPLDLHTTVLTLRGRG